MNTQTPIQLSLFDVSSLETKPTKSLQDILEFLDSIWSINAGGCGVAALAIYRWCKQHESVSDRPFVFLWRKGDYWEVNHNDEALENGELDSVEIPCHVVVELFDGLYDSTGETDCESYPLHQAYKLNETELLHIVNESQDGWNSTFTRALFIPQIEEALGVDLSDVVR